MAGLDSAGVTSPTVPLRLQAPRPIRRSGEPVAVGIPFARGSVRDAATLRLRGSEGPVALDTAVLERWPDGSVRWALCRFRADSRPGVEPGYEVHAADGASITAGGALHAVVTGKAARVSTARTTWHIIDDPGFRLDVAEGDTASPWVSVRLRVANGQGLAQADQVDDVRIESDGRLETTIAVSGRVAAIKGISYLVTLRF